MPRAVAEPAVLVRLAEKDVLKNRFHDCLRTLGAALYRSGRFDEAVKRLTEATEIAGDESDAWNWLFLAMALHRQGHSEEARGALTHAVERIDQLSLEQPGQPSAISRLPWHERMSLLLLRGEAESLVLESGFPADPFQRP
jgi:tetratricopeptide (TPR) repeat protein